MNVYGRFFRITSGPVMAAVEECRKINQAAKKEYATVLKELGAEDEYYHLDDKLVAVKFKDDPAPNLFKRMKCGGWYPKRNNKEGRALHSRFEAVVTKPINSALTVVGLEDSPTIFDSSRGEFHFPTLTLVPSDPIVVFIRVPWYDENPEKVAEYAKARQGGCSVERGNLEAVLWEPYEGMEEVKEWEVRKEIREWNEALRK